MTRLIRLKAPVYEELAARRAQGETFNDVVARLLGLTTLGVGEPAVTGSAAPLSGETGADGYTDSPTRAPTALTGGEDQAELGRNSVGSHPEGSPTDASGPPVSAACDHQPYLAAGRSTCSRCGTVLV